MTADDSARDPNGDAADQDAQPQPPLDEEAAWRMIVEHYGDRPDLGTDEPRTPDAPTDPPARTASAASAPTPAEPPPPVRDPFDRSYLDAMDAARHEPAPRQDRRRDDDPTGRADRDGEEHYVPPEPPPVPRATPARRLAWCGLFLPPLLMLAAVVLDWTFPSWVSFGLVAAFVGGFVFLVATMPRDGGDGWGDGAVV